MPYAEWYFLLVKFHWGCTIKVDIGNSKSQYIEKEKQEARKAGSESTEIQHGIYYRTRRHHHNHEYLRRGRQREKAGGNRKLEWKKSCKKIVGTSRQTNSEKLLTFLYISHILMAVIVLWILERPTASGRFLFVGISFFVIL